MPIHEDLRIYVKRFGRRGILFKSSTEQYQVAIARVVLEEGILRGKAIKKPKEHFMSEPTVKDVQALKTAQVQCLEELLLAFGALNYWRDEPKPYPVFPFKLSSKAQVAGHTLVATDDTPLRECFDELCCDVKGMQVGALRGERYFQLLANLAYRLCNVGFFLKDGSLEDLTHRQSATGV